MRSKLRAEHYWLIWIVGLIAVGIYKYDDMTQTNEWVVWCLALGVAGFMYGFRRKQRQNLEKSGGDAA
ncbi:MAG: hypothetical protein RMM53_02980 [Bacteroidia bacterium]|nr:hypothetical protein [Bacteroidia bacterium]MDW8333162.1 hypothetical protein [Bacteroidia bacterium]